MPNTPENTHGLKTTGFGETLQNADGEIGKESEGIQIGCGDNEKSDGADQAVNGSNIDGDESSDMRAAAAVPTATKYDIVGDGSDGGRAEAPLAVAGINSAVVVGLGGPGLVRVAVEEAAGGQLCLDLALQQPQFIIAVGGNLKRRDCVNGGYEYSMAMRRSCESEGEEAEEEIV
ncbi:hypothetical protein S40288_11573 [Stachybotrys chartarum IBT 40288]|nr:hypothetical protein S40288_11573 [Stachybotrys chartarum IBT 40288]